MNDDDDSYPESCVTVVSSIFRDMEEFKFVEKERCAKMFSNPKGQSEEGNECYIFTVAWANSVSTDHNNSRLFLSAEMFKKPLWQKVWTQIRLLL